MGDTHFRENCRALKSWPWKNFIGFVKKGRMRENGDSDTWHTFHRNTIVLLIRAKVGFYLYLFHYYKKLKAYDFFPA